MDIFLKISDIDLLLDIVNDREIRELLILAKCKGEYLVKDRYFTGKYLIRLSEYNCKKVQESLCEYLAEFGIGDDGEVNSVGKQVDTLIDSFQR